MKALVSILTVLGALTVLGGLSACGDDDDDDGAAGGGGMPNAGSAGTGGKAGAGAGSGGVNGGGGGSGGQVDHAVCADAQALADERQLDLECPNGAGMVEEECEAVLALAPDCEDEFEALQACGADQPAANWVCDDDGEAALMEDVCGEEALVVLGCAAD